MHFAVVSLSFGAAAAVSQPMQAPQVITSFASAPDTCAVLQAAYTAAMRRMTLIYPRDVRSDLRMLDLDKTVPEFRAKLALSAREFDHLAKQSSRYNFPSFRPACVWRGNPGPSVDAEGHDFFVTFTSPIFAADRRLAIVEVSFREAGSFAYGMICVVRQRQRAWKGKCENGWIT